MPDVAAFDIQASQVAFQDRPALKEILEGTIQPIQLLVIGTVGVFDEAVSLWVAYMDEPVVNIGSTQRNFKAMLSAHSADEPVRELGAVVCVDTLNRRSEELEDRLDGANTAGD